MMISDITIDNLVAKIKKGVKHQEIVAEESRMEQIKNKDGESVVADVRCAHVTQTWTLVTGEKVVMSSDWAYLSGEFIEENRMETEKDVTYWREDCHHGLINIWGVRYTEGTDDILEGEGLTIYLFDALDEETSISWAELAQAS